MISGCMLRITNIPEATVVGADRESIYPIFPIVPSFERRISPFLSIISGDSSYRDWDIYPAFDQSIPALVSDSPLIIRKSECSRYSSFLRPFQPILPLI